MTVRLGDVTFSDWISLKFEGKQPGDVVTLEDAHYDALLDALDEDRGQWVLFYLRQLLPYIDAIKQAEESS